MRTIAVPSTFARRAWWLRLGSLPLSRVVETFAGRRIGRGGGGGPVPVPPTTPPTTPPGTPPSTPPSTPASEAALSLSASGVGSGSGATSSCGLGARRRRRRRGWGVAAAGGGGGGGGAASGGGGGGSTKVRVTASSAIALTAERETQTANTRRPAWMAKETSVLRENNADPPAPSSARHPSAWMSRTKPSHAGPEPRNGATAWTRAKAVIPSLDPSPPAQLPRCADVVHTRSPAEVKRSAGHAMSCLSGFFQRCLPSSRMPPRMARSRGR